MTLSSLVPIPGNWSGKLYSSEVPTHRLVKGTTEYNNARLKANVVNIYAIDRVENVYLYGRYLLKKKMYEFKETYTERTLLHATFPENALAIAKNNFDYRLVTRYRFGKGVNFTPFASYANKEGCRSKGCYHKGQRAIIITKVLIGKTTSGSYYSKIPKPPYDTTTSGSNVYVKYYDEEFYPEYIVYYHY